MIKLGFLALVLVLLPRADAYANVPASIHTLALPAENGKDFLTGIRAAFLVLIIGWVIKSFAKIKK
ncbi:hypothetical protein PP175_11400 [Aneurinibacillus sp. Ricciae_BoGa-3]|uniref:hypothetical protein n=1 Tax=Aneurinibacillus sp. Ricciae_BoGa-3 TaxID=3022697 RepID=UPI00234136CA|nr:hypothetical protein [Aneurinibacillus sp. Ricciae_BoGa-3]WCK56463.1 hypothetical protein PP175_11400 [Aneurinibacillus sp. Ricciae_BoGa-3]